MERLPSDLLALVCAALTGFDVLRLSHASASLRRASPPDRLWRRLVQGGDATSDDAEQVEHARLWKREYLTARSLRFRGLPRREPERRAFLHGAFVLVRAPPRFQRLWPPAIPLTRYFGPRGTRSSVSIDTWFSLLPQTREADAGGVLLGCQSAEATRHVWPYFHQQPIVVDADRRLFCSLLDGDARPVGPALETNRWYHLALTYSGHHRAEKVFLDGRLVCERAGDWHREWSHLDHAQVGTGCVTAGGRCLPEPGFIGWYGFHGVVDEFRVWEGDLLDEQVRKLASGGAVRDETSLWYSLRSEDAQGEDVVGAQLVRCTRPVERTYQQLP